MGRGLGWLCDGHWGGHLAGWALGVMLYVGKLNSNKKIFFKWIHNSYYDQNKFQMNKRLSEKEISMQKLK